VTTDLDTLLTARYVLIDDHVMPSGQRRPGHPKKLSDAELVCLAVAQVLLGARSERDWIRQCYKAAGAPVPYLPHQPGYHERIKVVAPLICKTATSTSPGHMQIEEVPCPTPPADSSSPTTLTPPSAPSWSASSTSSSSAPTR
jgi:hypothetical protein